MQPKSKLELEFEVAELRKKLEQLEAQRWHMTIVDKETSAMFRLVAIGLLLILTLHTVLLVKHIASPFSGSFVWLLLGIFAMYLFVYLIQLAMHIRQRLKLNVVISEKQAQVEANVGEVEAPNPHAAPKHSV